MRHSMQCIQKHHNLSTEGEVDLINDTDYVLKSQFTTLKRQSYQTIGIPSNKFISRKFNYKPTQEEVRGLSPFQSVNQLTDGYIDSQKRYKESMYIGKQINSNKQEYIKSKAYKLHQLTIEIPILEIKQHENPPKIKSSIISLPAMSRKPLKEKRRKRYENQQIPSFIQIHLDNTYISCSNISPMFASKKVSKSKPRQQLDSHLTTKRIDKIPLLSNHKLPLLLDDIKSIRPQISEIRIFDGKDQDCKIKVKTRGKRSSHKVKMSTKRASQNLKFYEEICGW